MKKQSAHSCIKDNRFIYGTRDDTGRSLMSQGVPGCPTVPSLIGTGQWDNGTTIQKQRQAMSNYSLQKYKGTATRHTCPNCGDKRSFTCYVDESGMLLHPSVGRCNHESSCGYHYTPKEYFHDHPECHTDKGFSFDRQRSERKPGQTSPKASIGYIPPKYVERSQSVHSNFFRFISSLLDSYYGSKAKEVLKRLLEEYRLGATRDGAVIFWQIDRTNRVRTGKVMQYNPEDGHRIKGGQTSAVNWIHSILKKQRVLAEDWQLSQCLFGEHLLKTHPDKVVVLVESEKSAVIGSAIFPDYVWLATGGKSQMREEKLRVLSGRTVLLFPDADAYAEWKQRAESMYFCKVVVSDIIERNATPKQKEAHIDIADWIIFQIREGKVMSTANHLVEAERILQRMIEKNPVLQKLIDDLDLVLVGASPIGNDDEKPP